MIKKRNRVVRAGNLYERTAILLRQHIQARQRPGDRLDSIATLSAELGVSGNTMRGALALLAREGIVSSRHGSGTYVSDSLPRFRVGILIEQNILNRRTSSFFSDVVDELRGYLVVNGVRSRVYIGTVTPGQVLEQPTCWDFMEDLAAHRLDGVAAIGTDPHPAWRDALESAQVPVVGTSSLFEYRVTTDYAAEACKAVQVLVGQGCRRLALLSPALTRVGMAFRESVEAAGLGYHECWVRGDLSQSVPGAGWEEFREIWTARPEKPDGLICTDDFLFRDAVVAMQEMGLSIPSQLKIVTHSNKGSGILSPYPVTLAEYSPRDFAREAGAMLLNLLHGDAVLRHHVAIRARWINVEGAGQQLLRMREEARV